MTNEELKKLQQELEQGQSPLWDAIFLNHHQHCTNLLMQRYQCSNAIAQDCYMDAILIFRVEVLNKRYKNQNLEAYLWTITKNNYLHTLKGKNLNLPFDVQDIERHLFRQSPTTTITPLEEKEEQEALELLLQQEYKAYQIAFNKLGKACKTLLKQFYIDKIPLKTLQKQLHYSSYDVIKDKRRRCFNKLKEWANDYLK